MEQFLPEPIAAFLGCEFMTSEYSSPIHPVSTTFAFKAASSEGTLALTVNPAQGICFLTQLNEHGNEVATATVYVTTLEVRTELNEETGEDEQFIVGTGPGGHISITRECQRLSVFYSMYGDRSKFAGGHTEKPTAGLVPNDLVARRLAEAVLAQIYGFDAIESQKPFKVNLSAGVWTVEGSYPKGTPTGIALAQIRQEDGQFLRVTHGTRPSSGSAAAKKSRWRLW